METIKINGKTYENRTANLENWYNFTDDQKTTIETKYGKPLYLVRQMYDANGQKMTKGQKTLCVFELGAFVDKTTLNKLCGIEIAERANTGNTNSGKTAAEKVAAAVEKIAAAVTGWQIDDAEKVAASEHLIAVVEILKTAAEKERETAAAEKKRAAAIAALVAVGFDAETAAATVDRQGK
jgi:hypothetical protein